MKQLLTFLTTVLLLTSCGSMDEVSEDMVPSEVSAYTKDYINKLVEGDTDYCYNQLEKQFQDDKAKTFFQDCHENLKDKNLEKSAIINYRSTTMFGDNPTSNYEIGYEYEYDDSWVYYSFKLVEQDGQFKVYAFNLSPFENSLRAVHQFTLNDKGLLHYFFLFMIIAIPLFILISIGFSIKTPLKKKWLWIIFMLLGFVSFNLNWTDGEFGMKLLTFKLLGAGFSKTGIIAPWIFSFAIPVGAIAFWFKRAQIIKEHKTQELINKYEKEKNAP
jgi:hypothetical protein